VVGLRNPGYDSDWSIADLQSPRQTKVDRGGANARHGNGMIKTFTPLARRGSPKHSQGYRDSRGAAVADDGGLERSCNLLGVEFQHWVGIVSIFSCPFLRGWSG